MTIMFDFGEDYKKGFILAVNELVSKAPEYTREQRITLVEKLTDAYVDRVGERPDPSQLHRLADVILREELTDMHPDKMTINEYPIMSDSMRERRMTGSFRPRRKDGTVIREVPIEHASNVAMDGLNYTQPIRNFKNPFI